MLASRDKATYHESVFAYPMLTSIKLKNFRGFAELEIPKFSRVNLIGGVNNAGKTGLLEAIYLLLERKAQKISSGLPNLFRAQSGVNEDRYFWRWLAHNGSKDSAMEIGGDVQPYGYANIWWDRQNSPTPRQGTQFVNAAERRLTVTELNDAANLTWPHPEVFSPRPSPPIEDAQVFIKASKKTKGGKDGEERMESLLREIEPRLKRVRAYPDEQTNQPLVHVGLRGVEDALPAPQLGQGFNRLLRIYSAMLSAEAKVFLIDEVETGLHHSVLPTIWKGLAAVAREEGVQIFATTHSREAILAAHRVFSKETNYDFAYHRLERTDGCRARGIVQQRHFADDLALPAHGQHRFLTTGLFRDLKLAFGDDVK